LSMPLPTQLLATLSLPGNLVFPENESALKSLAASAERFVGSSAEKGTLWQLPGNFGPGLRVLEAPTGHCILYGEHGQRILHVDPGGSPLHECAWEVPPQHSPHLLQARLQLDWRQWIGIRPEGLVSGARFDISKKPGWQRLTKTDLHRMAAQAMHVTPEEVAFFYDDESLGLDDQGQVTIRHKKDALYVLDDKGIERTRFMACMGAMHWGQVDFLPVVELFQSLLAGTGSAVFELIRGLYDDQTPSSSPPLLRYRGIPTYPSPQAYQLFSTYFRPEAPGGADPFPMFMEPGRSGEVTWRPRPDAPSRFFSKEHKLCVTVAGGVVQKVTKQDDPAALPFIRPKGRGLSLGVRMAGATKEALQLQDGEQREGIPLQPEWGITKESLLPEVHWPEPTWRSLFPDGTPKLDARQAYFAIPMYPDDDSIVEELATQPLAMEQILEYLKQTARVEEKSGDMLIDQWDAAIADCLETARFNSCLVLYHNGAYAQRQAQRVWNQIAAAGQLSATSKLRFVSSERRPMAYDQRYGLILRWTPFEQYGAHLDLEKGLRETAQALSPGGCLIMAGPSELERPAARVGLKAIASSAIAETAGVSTLRTILPKARIRPDATLYLLRKA
jgi:hypothetical protein